MYWTLVCLILSVVEISAIHGIQEKTVNPEGEEKDIDTIINNINLKQSSNTGSDKPSGAVNPPKTPKDTVITTPDVYTTSKTTTMTKETATRVKTLVDISDVYFIAIVAGCSAAGLIGLILAVICWFRLQRRIKAASDIDYPAYGVTGPSKERSPLQTGDRKLAQSAQMYHYQHQKQQMLALEKATNDTKQEGSEEETDEENDDGDYTVYECPGLAPTGEMEVKNPLFTDAFKAANNTPEGSDSPPATAANQSP